MFIAYTDGAMLKMYQRSEVPLATRSENFLNAKAFTETLPGKIFKKRKETDITFLVTVSPEILRFA